MKKNRNEYAIGFILLALVLGIALAKLDSAALVSRLIIGIGIGYVLVRASFGFAGTANRAYNSGSTKLMRAVMFLVILASFVTVFFVAVPASDVNPDFAVSYGLFINPINLGLIIGAIIFGIGMAFAGGCASGVLTDLSSSFTKAILALFFFGLGRIIGIPMVAKYFQSITSASWFTSSEAVNGVWFPDLFKFDGFNGFIGALLLTIVIALVVIKLSYIYEEKRKKENTYTPIESEEEAISELIKIQDVNATWYERVIARPWTLWEGAIGMAIMYAALMGFTKGAWGVSGPFGVWTGKVLSIFFGKEAVSNFVGNPDFLASGVFTNAVSLQDIGIILGGFIALLTMGRLFETFPKGLKITGLQAVLAIVGGLLMGIGTVFAKGCNAGGLFSPLVSFSLSGWFYLVFMIVGSILGNKIIKAVSK